jgi:hypothetical protein
MRIFVAIAVTLIAAAAGIDGTQSAAQADPYRWCAQYGGRGATNCYFVTLEQCRAAISGNGGFCGPNTFYNGRPVVTPEDVRRRSRS